MINKESVVNVLKGIIDPEMGIDVYTLRLIKDLQISEKDGVIDLVFRPTSSVCPLAFQLTIEIKKGLLALEEVKDVNIQIDNYSNAEALNKLLKQIRKER